MAWPSFARGKNFIRSKEPCILWFLSSGNCISDVQMGLEQTIRLSSECDAPSQADHMQLQPSTGEAFLAGKPAERTVMTVTWQPVRRASRRNGLQRGKKPNMTPPRLQRLTKEWPNIQITALWMSFNINFSSFLTLICYIVIRHKRAGLPENW